MLGNREVERLLDFSDKYLVTTFRLEEWNLFILKRDAKEIFTIHFLALTLTGLVTETVC